MYLTVRVDFDGNEYEFGVEYLAYQAGEETMAEIRIVDAEHDETALPEDVARRIWNGLSKKEMERVVQACDNAFYDKSRRQVIEAAERLADARRDGD